MEATATRDGCRDRRQDSLPGIAGQHLTAKRVFVIMSFNYSQSLTTALPKGEYLTRGTTDVGLSYILVHPHILPLYTLRDGLLLCRRMELDTRKKLGNQRTGVAHHPIRGMGMRALR